MMAYSKTFLWTFGGGKSNIHARLLEPRIIEIWLKKDKWLWKKPAKNGPVTRQELPTEVAGGGAPG
jgi:hypothetical protein